jgi:hypothetical protein
MLAYPYGAASTGIGAKFLDPENLSRVGMTYGSVEYLGKRLNESSFKELRAKYPGDIVVLHFYELPRDQKLLDIAGGRSQMKKKGRLQVGMDADITVSDPATIEIERRTSGRIKRVSA